MGIDLLQQLIECHPVLWEILEILLDHIQRTLEHGVKDLRYLRRDAHFQFANDGRHCAQHLGFTCLRHLASLIVQQDGIEQRRYETVNDHIIVVRSHHPFGDQDERFLFNYVHRLDQRLIVNGDAVHRYCLDNVLRHDFINVQHVQVDATELQHKRMAERFACTHIGAQNAAQLLNGRHALQMVDVLRCLRYDVVPYLIRQCHVFFDQDILGRLINLGGNHAADRFVECVHLGK